MLLLGRLLKINIQARTAFARHREVGVLHLEASDSPDVALIGEIAHTAGIPCEAFEDASLAKRFPFLRSTKAMRGVFEPVDAGFISPRRLVQAQTVAAQRAGARSSTSRPWVFQNAASV
ncbi:hypothetical protein [Variovorax sp. MHTC-1]|uniref:hypothetical protein n=1 Tax=Variovorax sp. MHTC-1 TaxID=2495593 RepID=UPI000F873AD4|nr:hypothetical protein [Variovorax sp. MHTC-1]RST49379.1 hypothetical protein EJI01_24090 [Variovorax sp. MHTC-1]